MKRTHKNIGTWLAISCLAWWPFAMPPASADAGAEMHPRFALLDRQGENVLESAKPVSTMWTCGVCHDSDYVHSHSYHVCVGLPDVAAPGKVPGGRPWDTSPGMFGRWDPLTYRLLTPPGESPLDLGTAEWIQKLGWRHVGGGPALRSRSLARLEELPAGKPGDPETTTLDPATGKAVSWNWKKSGTEEMNCFLCHLDNPATDRRSAELKAGNFAWAETATLAGTGLVEPAENGWKWNRDAFSDDGKVGDGLQIVQPRSRHCGACHGYVHEGTEPAAWSCGLENWSTETKGQVFSAQPMSLSAMNLAHKTQLTRSWDIHAERLLRCSSCHYSLNQPSYRFEVGESRSLHLKFEPRKLDISKYLKRPNHQFARGESAQGPFAPVLRGSMRRCEDCHDYLPTHSWLPYARRHTEALLCESCHIPKVYAPARRQTDWTVLKPSRGPLVEYRGVEGDVCNPNTPTNLLTGYTPVLLPRKMNDGTLRLAPHNVLTSWFWVTGDPPRPVRRYDLERALFDGASYQPAVLAALDTDKNGRLGGTELRLDTPEKVQAVQTRLREVGVKDPRICGEIQPVSISHNVAGGDWSTRECTACHSRNSRVSRSFQLASYIPGGVLPVAVGDSNVLLEAIRAETDPGDQGAGKGGVSLSWRLKAPAAGLFVLGSDRCRWVDWIGIVLTILTLLGILGHGGLRVAVHLRRERRSS